MITISYAPPFTRIDADNWLAIRKAALGWGITIENDKGSAEAMGATIEWSRSPETGILHVSIVKSDFISEANALELVDQIIHSAIRGVTLLRGIGFPAR
jgi:hypothetical protein